MIKLYISLDIIKNILLFPQEKCEILQQQSALLFKRSEILLWETLGHL